MPKVNHCIHGTEIDGYCPACELDVRFFEDWTGVALRGKGHYCYNANGQSVVDLLTIGTDY